MTLLLACSALACSSSARDDEDAFPTSGLLSAGTDGGQTSSSGASGASAGEAEADTDIVFDVGQGGGDGNPDGPTSCEENVDIVFVMDVSTSMDAFLNKLAQEILVVDQALQAFDLPAAPHYGLVVFVDDYALLMGGAPYPDVQALQADFMQWSAFTSSNQQVGGGNYNSTWPENSLDALYAAATGFAWRPADSTSRIIIHTTDDTFWDGPMTANGVQIERGYAETVDALQQAQVRVFSFTATLGGQCKCQDVTAGWSAPYMGMDAIPEATDGAVFPIEQVLTGQISLSAGINDAVEEKMCVPYPPQG
jgi:hypothetical protein